MQIIEIQHKKMPQFFKKRITTFLFDNLNICQTAIFLTHQLINPDTKKHYQKHNKDSKQQQNPLHGLHHL